MLQASAICRGFLVARGLVVMRTKASSVCHGKATISSDLNAASSQERQAAWWAESLSYAYSRMLASSSFTRDGHLQYLREGIQRCYKKARRGDHPWLGARF